MFLTHFHTEHTRDREFKMSDSVRAVFAFCLTALWIRLPFLRNSKAQEGKTWTLKIIQHIFPVIFIRKADVKQFSQFAAQMFNKSDMTHMTLKLKHKVHNVWFPEILWAKQSSRHRSEWVHGLGGINSLLWEAASFMHLIPRRHKTKNSRRKQPDDFLFYRQRRDASVTMMLWWWSHQLSSFIKFCV